MWHKWIIGICALWPNSVRACPDECRCDQRNRVYCNNRNLSKIPANIPVHTKILYLQDNALTSSEQLERELGHLSYLERLMLYNNQLDTFPKLCSKYLRELRINNNRISRISSDALSEVPNLSNLILDENELTNGGIELGAFQHLPGLTRISLNRNRFTEFPLGFSSSIKQIFLTDNEISYMSHSAIGNLTNLETVFVNRNKLRDASIEQDALSGLTSLRELELSNNLFTHLPGKIAKSVEKIYLTSNQLEFIRTIELCGLSSLRTLDVAYNHLRAIEKGALDQLESLLRLDLSGNNWSCDCHLKTVKMYLSQNPVHYGAREQFMCSDPDHTGITVDTIHEDAFTCHRVDFNVTQTKSAVVIRSGLIDDVLPPFAEYRLKTEEINTAGEANVDEIVLDLPSVLTLTKLKPSALYRVCLYNSYIWDGNDLPEEFCSNFKTSNTVINELQIVTTEEIVGIVIGCLLIAAIFMYVFLSQRAKQFLKSFSFSSKLPSGENHEVEPSRLGRSYSSKLASYSQHAANKYSNQPDLTLDASKEFNVTLMLRAPGCPDQQQPQPPPPYGAGSGRDAKNSNNAKRNHSFTSSSIGSDETNKTLLSSRHDLGMYL